MVAPEMDSAEGIKIGDVLIHAGNVDGRDVSTMTNGADVTADNAPQAHGASVHTDRTRRIWIGAAHISNGTPEAYGYDLDKPQSAMYSFVVPSDFVSIGNVYVYYAATVSTGGDVQMDFDAYYATTGELQNTHVDSDANNVISVPDTKRERFTTSGLFISLIADDIAYINVSRIGGAPDTFAGLLTINGVLIEYTADM